MITYVYLVKCPNCDDEYFDFFKEAEAYALGKLSEKPIITQTEVNRNDFGECTDHCDLGTVWSWEDVLGKETEAEPTVSVFTKDDLKLMANGEDPEFDNLDNSVDYEIEEISDRKPIPEGMTIEELVEAMEENEDTVECTKCGGLFEKASCTHNKEGFGWCCTNCETPDTLLVEDTQDTVDLVYDKLNITLQGPKTDVDDWDEVEYEDSYTYTINKSDAADIIWEFMTEEDAVDVPGGLVALEDDDTWNAFIETHFDELFKKYHDQILEYCREDAEKDFEDNYSYYDYRGDLASDYGDWQDHAQRDEF